MDQQRLTILHANDIHGQLSFRVDKEPEYMDGISARWEASASSLPA